MKNNRKKDKNECIYNWCGTRKRTVSDKRIRRKIENADIIIGAKRLIKPYCNKKTFAAITPFDIISNHKK